MLGTNAIITGMVAVSFGSYASNAFTDGDESWAKVFAVLVVVYDALNVVGSQAVARVQTLVVVVVIGILSIFAVSTLANIDPDLLASSNYPPFADIVASVALTFFAFLGFGVITFTAKDLADPAAQLPRAMFLALGIATTIYVAVALGVFGTLTVDEVIASGGTALAVAAEPTLGRAGYWMMTVTALFATPGPPTRAVPGDGPLRADGSTGSSRRCWRRLGGRAPPAWSSRRRSRSCSPWASTYARSPRSAAPSPCSSSPRHARPPPGPLGDRCRTAILVLAIASHRVVLVAFVFTTLVDEPATAVALVAIVA